jgi:hypothetical protein
VARGLDTGSEVATGDAAREADRGLHGLEHRAAEIEPEGDKRHHHRAGHAAQRHRVALLRALHRRHGRGGSLVPRDLLGAGEHRGEGPVDAGDGPVAGERIGIGDLEPLQPRAVILAVGLVLRKRGFQEAAQLVMRRAGARVLQLHGDLAFGVLECLPVLRQQLGVLAAQEHVLPFLHLGLERHARAQDRVLRLEVLAADAVQVLDGAVDAGERGDADADGNGHHAGHQHQHLELQAADLHRLLFDVEVELDFDGAAICAFFIPPL